eukprot:788022-Prorocentrum_minimum.AAC.1
MGDCKERVRGGLVLPPDHSAANPHLAEPAPEAPRRGRAVRVGRGRDLRPSNVNTAAPPNRLYPGHRLG